MMGNRKSDNPFLYVLAVLWLLPFVPYWLHHAWYNSQQSNLAHTPWLAAAVAWLLMRRFAEVSDEGDRPRASVGLSFFLAAGLAVAGLALAVYLPSNLVGSAAGIFAIWALIRFFGGKAHAKALRTNWLLFFLCLPLPRNWMDLSVAQLQKLATLLASGMLDMIGIHHVPYGVTLQSVRRVYLIEEACSGINALYAALAFIGFCLVLQRTGMFRTGIALLKTVFWVVVANAVRVFVVVLFDTRFNVDLTIGWPHQLVGLLTFVLAIGLALSSFNLLNYFSPPSKPTKTLTTDSRGWFRPIKKFFFSAWSSRSSLVAGCLMLLVAANLGIMIPSGLKVFNGTFQQTNFSPVIKADFPADGLFAPVNGWSITSEAVREDRESLQNLYGATSYAWTFAKEGRSVTVSVDGMFNFWHDLSKCYTNSGWKVSGYEHRRLSPSAEANDSVEVKLIRNADDHALLFFSLLDIHGNTVAPPDITSPFIRAERTKQASQGLYQIQVMAGFGSQPDADDIPEIRELFRQLRDRLALTLELDGAMTVAEVVQ